jgi:hypothetical protein
MMATLGILPSVAAVGATEAPTTIASATTDSTTADTTADTTIDTTATAAPTTVPASSTLAPATRGTVVQAVATLPPPPVTTAAPPSPYVVPADSGTGRRVVYSKSRMRVWMIDAAGSLVNTYLVSGRVSQPELGTYSVFSRSSFTCHKGDSSICMRWMVRFTRGPSGDNIGFHEIPRRNGVPMQSDSQLGQALSGGCVRQRTADAQFMWGWADIGTRVVVIW